jgi:hypothetical protein
LHAKVHIPAVHVDVAWATSGHLRPHEPQWSALVRGSTHCVPQSSGVVTAHPVVHSKFAPTGEHIGAVAGHALPQRPQFEASDRSVSQPSAGF